jgi:hypothetical protein
LTFLEDDLQANKKKVATQMAEHIPRSFSVTRVVLSFITKERENKITGIMMRKERTGPLSLIRKL